MLKEKLSNLRQQAPLIHNITNYVTVNDCANILLACGASPIMADDINEVAQITTICSGLNINIGTLNSSTIESMLVAGKKANSLAHPVILDPVGAGASTLRTETACKLLREVKFAVIRGNMSEIRTLALGSTASGGVDVDICDMVSDETLDAAVLFAKSFAKQTGSVIAITGAIDIVANEKSAYIIRNGDSMMSKVTGTGCMLSAMVAAYVCANKEDIIGATAAAVCAMGICGERAKQRLNPNEGNASLRNNIIDEIYNLDEEKLESGAKYDIR
ncbi:MAG: hydroxyethylthiazole kinase [Oscillospiraceae bacterium]